MIVEPPCNWDELINRADLPPARYLLHAESTTSQFARSNAGIAVAIGPEGGFTTVEIDRARGIGWQTLSLGPRILRIETAALAVTALCSGFQ